MLPLFVQLVITPLSSVPSILVFFAVTPAFVQFDSIFTSFTLSIILPTFSPASPATNISVSLSVTNLISPSTLHFCIIPEFFPASNPIFRLDFSIFVISSFSIILKFNIVPLFSPNSPIFWFVLSSDIFICKLLMVFPFPSNTPLKITSLSFLLFKSFFPISLRPSPVVNSFFISSVFPSLFKSPKLLSLGLL